MDRLEEEGAGLLAPLRNVEPNAESRVDISRAVRAGRARGRRRVLAGVAAAAGVTALSLIAVPSLLRALPDGMQPADRVTEFSLARQTIAVGAAGGFTPTWYRTGRVEQIVELERTDGGAGFGQVTAYAPGHHPAIGTGTPADDVNGRPAYWLPGHSQPTLAMREGDVWVTVSLGGPATDLMERTQYVARGVVFGADLPVRVPFRLDAEPPAPLRVVGVQVSLGPRRGARVLLSTRDTIGKPELAIGVSDDPNSHLAPTNDWINNRPARVDHDSVTVFLDGRGGSILVRYDDPARIGGIQTLKNLAAAVQLEGNFVDPATWILSPWN